MRRKTKEVIGWIAISIGVIAFIAVILKMLGVF